MMHKAWSSTEDVPYCFSRWYICQIARSLGSKNRRFWPKLGVSRLYLQFEITDGYEMMHKARSSIKEVPYCFSRSYVKLQCHTAKKSSNLTQIGRFLSVTPVWIHWWIWNDTQSLMLYGRRALLFFGVIHQISRSHGRKIDDLNPIWVRLLGRSLLSNPSDLPC